MLNRRSPTSLGSDEIDAYAQEYIEHLDQCVEGTIERVVDKHMGAERTLGLISRLFPQARVIHCLRDPIDSCLSSYFQNFGTNVSYSRDLVQLGRQYVGQGPRIAHDEYPRRLFEV